MTRIRPKNWGEFQHYKDRDPTWIKLHKKLLDDYEYQRLPLASRALAPMLWLLASEDKEGWIDADVEKIAFRLRVTNEDLDGALKPLISAGFFEIDRDDTEPLAEVERDAIPEKKEESRSQVVKQEQVEVTSAHADEAAAIQAYNAVAEEAGWPIAQRSTEKRRRAITRRLRDCGGIDGWRTAMAKARASPFLRGEKGRGKDHTGWAPDLDFFLQESSFTKLMEGKYDDRSSNQEPTGFDAITAGAMASAFRA